ncbi:MAG: hypothetical protein EOS64_31480 [Mesorhizobium sp.]|nr:MAG: hypothetical protein EOS64_31480 [Mesorhizobium sp.]
MVSAPAPPLITSSPPRPEMTFAAVLPVSVSPKAEPIRFSKPETVSLPAPTVFCAAVVARLTVRAAAACS